MLYADTCGVRKGASQKQPVSARAAEIANRSNACLPARHRLFSMIPESTDESLLVRFVRQGDRRAMDVLLERHASLLYRTAFLLLRDPAEAEEAAQEACLRLMRGASTYDPERPLVPWLKTLVARTALELRRTRKRIEIRDRQAPLPSLPEDPAMIASHAEILGRLREEVDALPENLRTPLVLHYQAGCSYAEVAAALGCPEGTVATRLHTARERLRTALAPAGILLTVGTSLEEALAEAAPESAVPPGLPHALQALTKTGSLDRPPAPRGPFLPRPTRRGLAFAAAAILVIGGAVVLKMLGTASPLPPPLVEAWPHAPPPPARHAPIKGNSPAPEAASEANAPARVERGNAKVLCHVTCQETGLAVEGATVTLRGSGLQEMNAPEGASDALDGRTLGDHTLSRLTDREGRCSFEILTEGIGGETLPCHYSLTVSAAGCAPYDALSPGSLLPFTVPKCVEIDGLPASMRKLPSVVKPPFPSLKTGEVRTHDLQIRRGWGIVFRCPAGGMLPASLFVNLRGPSCHLHAELILGQSWRIWTAKSGRIGPLGEWTGPLQKPTDGHVEMELGGLDPDRFPADRTVMTVSVPGYLKVRDIPLSTLPSVGDRLRCDLSLQPGRGLQGIVLGPDGRPRPDVRIHLWPSRLGLSGVMREDLLETRTGKDGSFRIQGGLPEETLLVWAYDRGRTLSGEAVKAMKVKAMKEVAKGGEPFVEPEYMSAAAMDRPEEFLAGASGVMTLQLRTLEAEVSGRVIGKSGEPLAGIHIGATLDKAIPFWDETWFPRTRTELDGSFVLKGLPGWCPLTLHADDHDGKSTGVRWSLSGIAPGSRGVELVHP